MKDPYAVLGLQKNATDEEIKNAYRALARKYQPEGDSAEPLSDEAAEKMQEINAAYDKIMNERRRKGTVYDAFDADTSSNFSDVRSLISAGRLEEAQELLDGIPPQSRDAEWYFLNGTVLYRRGWFDGAYTSFATACRMAPDNPEYRTALNNVQKQATGQGYNPYRTSRNMGGCSSCDVCSSLICADCCCECMGGDLISCC